jgi:hypothetical protein
MAAIAVEASRIGGPPVEADGAEEKAVAIEEDVISLPPTPVKDGGLRAWLQVLGCFLVFFNVWYTTQLALIAQSLT